MNKQYVRSTERLILILILVAATTAAVPAWAADPVYSYADEQFSGQQGKGGWSYVVFAEGDVEPNQDVTLEFDPNPDPRTNKGWQQGAAGTPANYDFGYNVQTGMHPGVVVDVAKVYEVPKTGVAVIKAKGAIKLEAKDSDGVEISIYLNSKELPSSRRRVIAGQPIIFKQMEVNVQKGDKLYFRVNNGHQLDEMDSAAADFDHLHWIPAVAIR